MIEKNRDKIEKYAFGVCAWWGNKLGMKSSIVRKTFIYLSFFTFGSPVIIYLFMAFILENKAYFKPTPKRSSVWDL